MRSGINDGGDMENKYLKRINEFSRIAKERELTDEEKKERNEVRQKYLEEFRKSMTAILDNTYIKYPDTTVEKLKRKEN